MSIQTLLLVGVTILIVEIGILGFVILFVIGDIEKKLDGLLEQEKERKP